MNNTPWDYFNPNDNFGWNEFANSFNTNQYAGFVPDWMVNNQQPVPAPSSAESNTSSAPSCPTCGGEMKLRTAKNDPNKKFYGCANYPNCNWTVWLNEDGSVKPAYNKPSTPTQSVNPAESSVVIPNYNNVDVPNHEEGSTVEYDENLLKRINAKKLYIYNNQSALQASVTEFDGKKNPYKKNKRLFIEVAPVDPSSFKLENKKYLWGKDKGTKKSVSLDFDECVTLLNFLFGKIPVFKIYHDPFAKTANSGKANSSITATWQPEQETIKYNNGSENTEVHLQGMSVKFTVSVKKMGEPKGTLFNFKVPRNDIILLKSLCIDMISSELEQSDMLVYQMIKDSSI